MYNYHVKAFSEILETYFLPIARAHIITILKSNPTKTFCLILYIAYYHWQELSIQFLLYICFILYFFTFTLFIHFYYIYIYIYI